MKGEYYKTKESVDEYIKLAKGVNGGQLIDKLLKYLSAESEVLEIGSGPGADWNILNESYKVTGSDFSTEFLNHLKAENKDGEFLKLDAAALNTKRTFDGIYSNKVLHHLTDEEIKNSIKRQYQILNEDGFICHSFWKGEGSEIFKGLFVNYYTENKLRSIFENYFEIMCAEEYAEFEPNDSILIIGKKR